MRNSLPRAAGVRIPLKMCVWMGRLPLLDKHHPPICPTLGLIKLLMSKKWPLCQADRFQGIILAKYLGDKCWRSVLTFQEPDTWTQMIKYRLHRVLEDIRLEFLLDNILGHHPGDLPLAPLDQQPVLNLTPCLEGCPHGFLSRFFRLLLPFRVVPWEESAKKKKKIREQENNEIVTLSYISLHLPTHGHHSTKVTSSDQAAFPRCLFLWVLVTAPSSLLLSPGVAAMRFHATAPDKWPPYSCLHK